jgi:hypothetical protein
MSRSIRVAALFMLLGLGTSSLVYAHHSAVAFDKAKTAVVEGKVTKFIWRNPHLAIIMDVDGVEWRVEGGSTNDMVNNGFDRNSISEGDTLTVMVNPLKSGKPGGLMQGVTLADGSTFGMEEVSYAESGSALPANPLSTERQIPALTEYVPPPAGDTWQKREARTRPELPMLSSRVRVGTEPGALDPEHLAKSWPKAAFDLTGTWAFRGEVEEQSNYGAYEFKPQPELTAKAQKFYDDYIAHAKRGERFFEPTAFCYPAGMPRLMTRYGSMMMMQYPTAIFMMSRLNNEYRVVYLDGRSRIPENLRDPNWNGESLGQWEGDTLVIETEGFTDENHIIQQGILAGSELKITERYSVINDGNTLVMDFTMTDPEHWVGEWKHTKFRDRILKADVKEATCLPEDNLALPGM